VNIIRAMDNMKKDQCPCRCITIKDLSRIISEARKALRKQSEDWNDLAMSEHEVIDEMFKELRNRLELRRRGRK
jgi:hypothetical protein